MTRFVSNLFRPWVGPYTDNPGERVLRFLPLLFFMCGIYAASALPGNRVPAIINDKLAHTIEYFVFGLLIALFMAGVTNNHAVRYWSTVLFGAFYAATDEIHQSFVPKRDASFIDFGCDVLGLTLAVIVISLGIRNVR